MFDIPYCNNFQIEETVKVSPEEVTENEASGCVF